MPAQLICDIFMLDVFLICPQTYSQLAHPIQQAKALGLRFQSKILDIDNIDVSVTNILLLAFQKNCSVLTAYVKSSCELYLQLAMGKMMEQGPVLIITFQAQVIMVIRSPKGDIVEGDPVSTITAPASGICLNQSQWRKLTIDQTEVRLA